MSDQEDEKKIVNDDISQSNDENQSEVDSNEVPKTDESQNSETTSEGTENNDQNLDQNQESEPESSSNEQNGGSGHEVIHKKDGRLHIYVRQDKYKGELKSKNWVGRLYIDGKQKISSSGTTNLDEAIPILEKWYDDIIAESERLKKQSIQTENNENKTTVEDNKPNIDEQPASTTPTSENTAINQNIENKAAEQVTQTQSNESSEVSKSDQVKNKLTNIFGKLKDLKIKKPNIPILAFSRLVSKFFNCLE